MDSGPCRDHPRSAETIVFECDQPVELGAADPGLPNLRSDCVPAAGTQRAWGFQQARNVYRRDEGHRFRLRMPLVHSKHAPGAI
jgi:hypothetical protein